jgi:hypothetical protein
MISSLSACEQPSARVWPCAGSPTLRPSSKVTFPESECFQNLDTKAPAIVRQAAARTQCERYVVVTRAASQYIGNQSIYGLGIVNSGGPLLSTTQLHAVVRIHVHDGHTFAVLKSGTGSLGGSSFLSGPPTKKLDDSWWPEPPEAANTPAMRDATRKLLGEVLDKSLPELLAQ